MFSKRVFFITSDQIHVYSWTNGKLSEPKEFFAGEKGLDDFTDYLTKSANSPSYIAIDIIEEDFRLDTVPHLLFGKDRNAVVARKLKQLFRSTPYGYSIRQGRMKDGRKDDKVLISAITNPDVLLPWLERMLKKKTPIAGIYSLPLVSQSILKILNITSENTLLVMHFVNSGIRQTFFQNQQLKMSRLATTLDVEEDEYTSFMQDEIAKTQLYLTRVSTVGFVSNLEVIILSAGKVLENLKKDIKEAPNRHYRFVDLAEATKRMGVTEPIEEIYSDKLLAYLMVKTSQTNHYGTARETQYSRLRTMKYKMNAMAIFVALVAFIGSAVNLVDGYVLNSAAKQAKNLSQQYEVEYQKAKLKIPHTPVEPFNLKEGVDIEKALLKYSEKPTYILNALSRALAQHPQLKIKKINWLATTQKNAMPTSEQQTNNVQAELVEEETENVDENSNESFQLFHVALIEGDITKFDGNYISAFKKIDRFKDTLLSYSHFSEVRIIKYPIDISSSAEISGETGAHVERPTASFVLKTVLRIGNERS